MLSRGSLIPQELFPWDRAESESLDVASASNHIERAFRIFTPVNQRIRNCFTLPGCSRPQTAHEEALLSTTLSKTYPRDNDVQCCLYPITTCGKGSAYQ